MTTDLHRFETSLIFVPIVSGSQLLCRKRRRPPSIAKWDFGWFPSVSIWQKFVVERFRLCGIDRDLQELWKRQTLIPGVLLRILPGSIKARLTYTKGVVELCELLHACIQSSRPKATVKEQG